MPVHLAARMHAFVNGLFRPSDEQETRALYDRVAGQFRANDLATTAGRRALMTDLTAEVIDKFEIPPDHPQAEVVVRFVTRLLDYERLFLLPEVDWSERRSISEYWAIREELQRQRAVIQAFSETRNLLRDAITAILDPLYRACPALTQAQDHSDIAVPTELIHSLGHVGEVCEAVLTVPFDEELTEAGLFTRLSDRLERNVIAASGGNPADPKGFNRAPRWPRKSDIKSPEELLDTYLGGTPLRDLFEQELLCSIPMASRFEHQHIVAGSGHGKSQTLQYLICQDLEAVARGERSVVVIDSQGDLIRNIAGLKEFAPGGPLHERVVIIDPTDVEYPVSLNLFDVGIDRLKGYAPLERERLTNSILELYDFVLGSLLSAEMTQKQNVIFRYVTRLMLHVPDATIHTLRELMEPGSHVKFAKHIAKLDGTARHFFETEFPGREFEQTKRQVLRRLWGILENQTFERMFSHPRSKLDLFGEMNAGKVILINTAKDLLKEQGTEIFGRFFIALIAQAAQERATLSERERLPTFVYIDEAADYFDRNVGIILSQARKYNVGMVLAHQYLGQLEPKLQEAVAANTAIKFAGGVSARDARTLAPMLYADPTLIERQPKGSFAAHIRGVTPHALPLRFPFGYLEGKERMSDADRQALQAKMRDRYAVHYTALSDRAAVPEPDPEPEPPQETPKPKKPKRQTEAAPKPIQDDGTAPGEAW